MIAKFHALIRLIALFISASLMFFSAKLFLDINRLQTSLEQINYFLQQDSSDSNQIYPEKIRLNSMDFKSLSWDSEINYTLASADLYSAASINNKGLQQAALSRTQLLLNWVQDFTPLNINSMVSNLSILIDQGAPIDYFLPKIDELIALVPKDQDLKAEIAKLCFKLSVVNTDSDSQSKIIDRLNKLFIYSMDYRGMRQIHRYAQMFNQNELLAKVKSNDKS